MREDVRYEICSKCKNQGYSQEMGIICNITGEKPAFENSCPNYDEKFTIKEEIESSKNKIEEYQSGLAKRFANFFLDAIILRILLFVFSTLFINPGIIFSISDNEFMKGAIEAGYGGLIILFIVVFGYYFVMEGIFNRTIGKLATGTIVVDNKGNKPSIDKIAIRTISRFIPFDPLSFIIGSEKTGWHDTFSKTKVLDKKFIKEANKGN